MECTCTSALYLSQMIASISGREMGGGGLSPLKTLVFSNVHNYNRVSCMLE